jgi:tRNA (adenine-N(1)-)-methyltransferase non-catalytic subunit
MADLLEIFNPSTIKDDSFIMIKLPSENCRVFKLTAGSIIKLGKFGSFYASDIIGHPFGYTYEIVGDRQLRIVSDSFVEDVNELEADENNQDLFDDPSAQQLTRNDIEEMKKSTTDGGRALIEKVISGHVAFDKKTTFSQEKYLKRKEQKFLKRFTPIPIGSSELIEYYSDKESPSKVMDLTEESLGLIMSLANIKPGGNYLVVDDVSGVLVAAMLERMGGEGVIVVSHDDEHPKLDGLRYLNLPEKYIESRVRSISWLDFLDPNQEAEYEYREMSSEKFDSLPANLKLQYTRRKRRSENYAFVRNLIDNKKFDALVISTTIHVPTLIPRVIEAVGGSRPVIIYDASKEPLLQTSQVLMKDLRILAPTIIETRVRKYQTLPGRMHPHMTMRGTGGYIMWGTRVFPNSNVNAIKITRGKKRKVASSEETSTLEVEM